MLLETVKTEGLAHLSYLLGDDGMCAVIDPRRDVEVYLDLARRNHVRITHVIETHIHADFVSGSRELAAATGAPIYVGASTDYHYPVEGLLDGDELRIGELTLRALHTPGHTPEHVCFVVRGGRGSEEPWAVFTGDCLFAGEVGRPDLLGEDTKVQLARQAFHSLHEKLLTLGDEVEVYPAHGAGSPCGGSIGDRNTSTIGYERRHNPKLQTRNEDEFVEQVLTGLPPAPRYYPRMKRVNAEGPRVLGSLPYLNPLEVEAFRAETQKPGALVLDTREIEAFGGAHIPGALSIPLRDSFPIWAGWMVKPEDRVLLVTASDADLETVQRHLLRIGIENVAGYLLPGIRGWFEAGLPFERLNQMSVHELHSALQSCDGCLQVLDVRRDDEWEAGFIPTAKHVYAPFVLDYVDVLDNNLHAVVYCHSGFRSSIAASVLQRAGFRDVSSVPGSMAAWEEAGYATEMPRRTDLRPARTR